MMAAEHKNRGFVWRGWPHLFLLLFAFFAGAVPGFLLAFWGSGNQAVKSYLLDHFVYAASGELHISFFSAVWECIQWPLFVLIFSFHALGIFIIPALICIRSFLLSYVVSVVSLAFPHDGLIISIILFSATILFVVPTLFLWGSEGLRSATAHRLSSSTSGQTHSFRVEILLIGIGTLFVAIAVHWTIVPLFLNSIFTQLF